MKLIFALTFIVLLVLCTILTKPIYRVKIENDLLSKTYTVLDKEGLINIDANVVRHELQFTAKEGVNGSVAVKEVTRAIEISDEIWGVYLPGVPADPVVLRSATFVGVERPEGVLLLTGELPSEELRAQLVAAARLIPGVSRVDDQLVVADDIMDPVWGGEVSDLLSRMVVSAESGKVSASGSDLVISGIVETDAARSELEILAVGVPHGEAGFLNKITVEPWSEPSLRMEREGERYVLTGVLPDKAVKHAKVGAGDAEPLPMLVPAAEARLKSEQVEVYFKELAVYFETSSSYVKSVEESKIERAAALIKKVGSVEAKLIVGGYADLRGNADFNRRLSLRRANAVRDKLIKLGIPAVWLRVEFFGEDTTEVATGDLWKSRRVEISFNKESYAPQSMNNSN